MPYVFNVSRAAFYSTTSQLKTLKLEKLEDGWRTNVMEKEAGVLWCSRKASDNHQSVKSTVSQRTVCAGGLA